MPDCDNLNVITAVSLRGLKLSWLVVRLLVKIQLSDCKVGKEVMLTPRSQTPELVKFEPNENFDFFRRDSLSE